MIPPRPDRRDEWLAAYADGELTAGQRARVEQWLSENPEAREDLETQESLGPKNTELWDAARGPSPTRQQWDNAFERIAAARHVGVSRRWPGLIASLALAATAASLLLFLPTRPLIIESDVTHAGAVAATDDEPLLLAGADEINILSLPEQAADLILVGLHPFTDSFLELAKAGEIEFLGVGSDEAGRFPEVPDKSPSTTETPIIWAPRGP